eukprot:12936157-Prorocentrum_lima.AAC.1
MTTKTGLDHARDMIGKNRTRRYYYGVRFHVLEDLCGNMSNMLMRPCSRRIVTWTRYDGSETY